MRVMIVLLAFASPVAFACDDPRLAALSQMSGEWQLSMEGAGFGKVTMTKSAGGCAFIEIWEGPGGENGTSLHWLDAQSASPVLRQVYVDDSGWHIEATGTLNGDVLEYRGASTDRAGNDVIRRNIIHGLGSDQLLQVAEVSRDGGITWESLGNIVYQRVGDTNKSDPLTPSEAAGFGY